MAIEKRIKFAGDVFDALMKKGWSCTDAANFLNSFPDADAVEVVHCKDCEEWQEYGGFHICEHFSSIDLPGLCKNIEFATRPDDYCSYGRLVTRNETEMEDNQ